jgi:hypothetical protein
MFIRQRNGHAGFLRSRYTDLKAKRGWESRGRLKIIAID